MSFIPDRLSDRRSRLPAAFARSLEVPVDGEPPLVCVSHLRWEFVYQRPQHLMSRFARTAPVLYLEEAVATSERPGIETKSVAPQVTVAVPRVRQADIDAGEAHLAAVVRTQLDAFLPGWLGPRRPRPIVWYYTPMGLPVAGHLDARLVVYDCMDELSQFKAASPDLLRFESMLLDRCDLVFTGGLSLYEAKRRRHPSTHAFPSSVDIDHFRRARQPGPDPDDMAAIPHPRIGFYGVIDERLDLPLLEAAAALRPDWHWVLAGPVVKIDPSDLPRAANLHHLGSKPYQSLPDYLRSWDVAMMPFALNAATRFISPTKTPEYLAGGKPVVSTPIADVVRTWRHTGIVQIAWDPAEFVAAVGRALDRRFRDGVAAKADALLAGQSWDRTQSDMAALMAAEFGSRPGVASRNTVEAAR